MSDKDGPTFELAKPVLVKVRDPFVEIKKKMGSILKLELRRLLQYLWQKPSDKSKRGLSPKKDKGRL